MLRNGVKRDNMSKTNPNIGLAKSIAQRVSSSDSYDLQSAKESNHISHTATSDRKRAAFATTLKNPYWDENHLWKDAFLVYSYKHPEDCLGPPANKSDKTIRFNSRFESGNLLYAYRLNPDVYHCILEYDHSTASQCQWFYFQMSNIKTIPNSNRKMTFYISGFNKASGVFSTGSKVFMYSEKLAKEKNIGWFRTGTNYAYGTISSKTDDSSFLDCEPDKENNKKKKGITKQHKLKRSTLQFQITFLYDDDVVYLCYAQPYTFTDLNSYITNWIRTSPSLITKSTLCKTYGGKDCPLLTITAPNSPSASKKKCIFITARIHPGESNGSIVLHGLIDYLLSKQPLTTYLLDHFIFKIVPMVNIDGVIEGFYRVGLEGEDLNRVWNQPDPRIHPVVYHTKNLMYELNKKMGIAAYIDFHGHSREHGTFAYGCPWEENENLPQNMINKEKVLPKIISSLCDAFSFEKCVFSIPQKRKDASRCVVRRELGVINSFTIESSFGGITAGLWGNTLYNEFIWKEIGAKIGEGLFHLFSDPSSQTLKTAENQIAAAAALVKPGFSQIESQTIRERPIVKKKAKSKSEKEENKIVIAIDTQDGIKVISTETKAPPSSSANNQTLTTTGNTSTLRLNHNNTNGITVIQKVEQNQPIETIYTLKITDLSSYSSSSSPSPVPASARVKRNPRINMNKKLNSTLNNNNDSKQLQICNSTENTAQNRRSNLSQRSNASLYSSSRLNEIRISSSSSHSNLINDTNPILVTTNDGQISCSNSTPKVVEIKVSHMNSSILDTSFENANNSILIPSANDEKSTNTNTNTNTNQNQIANSNENQKPSSSLKARNNRIQKSGSTSNTNTNPNSNSNSESNQSLNTKNQSEMITNKIVKPNTNSNRNSNPGSVSKTKLISKPNTNAATKVSIILNPNQSQQQETNFVPNPPSNRNESQKPNPHSSTNVAANAKATPHPPQQPLDSTETINSAAKTNQTSNTINIDQKQTQPSKSNQPSNVINQDQKQTQPSKSNQTSNVINQDQKQTQPSKSNQTSNVINQDQKQNQPPKSNQISNSPSNQNIKQVQSSNAASSNSKTNQQSNTTSNQIPKQTQPPISSNTKPNQAQIQSTNQNQAVKPANNSKPTSPPKTENAKANTQSNIENAKSIPVSNQENSKTNASSNAEIARTNSSQNPKSTTNVKQNPTQTAIKETPKQTQQQNQTTNQASNSKPSQQPAPTSTKNTTTKPNQTQNSAANQNNKQNQPQISQTNSNTKPIQQSNTAANQVQPQAAKNSNVKQSQPSNTESNVKTNPQQEIAASQQNAKTSQPTNTTVATKPNTTTTTRPNQPQNTAANQNSKSNPPQPTTTSTKQNTQQNTTTAAQTKPNPQQNTTTTKPNTQQNTTTSQTKPNPQQNTQTTTATKPNTPSNTTTASQSKPNPQQNTTTKPNTSNTQATKPTQNSNTTTEKQQTPSPTKISQSQSLYKNDNQKQILTTNKIEKSKTVTDLPTDSTTKQIQPSSNPKPNPRMNHITNLVPATKPATFYDDDDFGSNSYLSTQSDLDSFSFLHQEDITEISETNLFNYSTATFNSSSTYASPTKSPKLSPHEKSQQKSQDVKQTKTKKSHNSKTPKRK